MRLIADFSEADFMEKRYARFPGVVFTKEAFKDTVKRCIEELFADEDLVGDAYMTELMNEKLSCNFTFREPAGPTIGVEVPDWVQVQWFMHYVIKRQ